MALSRLCCATLDMRLVCATLQTVLCYTRYDAGGVVLSRLCCAILDMMLGGGTLQTVLCYTRYDAGVCHSPDTAMLHLI